MSQRSQYTPSPTGQTRRRPDRYNPHSGVVGVLEQNGRDRVKPIVGQLDPEPIDDDIVAPPRCQITATDRANSKNQRVKTTKPKAAPRTASTSSRTQSRLRKKAQAHDLKATIAPLLATVGVLLLVPAVWSTLLLAGITVPGAEREDSRPMAAIMLLSWPIAISLLAASVAFFVQVVRHKRQVAKKN